MTNPSDDGLGPGRSCRVCRAPLTPEPVGGGTLAIAWTCAEHGLADLTPDPLSGG